MFSKSGGEMFIDVRLYRLFLGVLTLLGGVSVLFGWHYDITLLTSFKEGLTPMNPSTALFTSLAGVWFMIHFFNGSKTSLSIIAASLFIFGLIHFFTFFFPIGGIRMDFLFFDEKVRSHPVSCLVAPNTSFVLMVLGYSLFTYRSFNRAELFCRQILIFLALIISSLTLLGYLNNVPTNFHLSRFRLMSPVSAVYFFILSLAVFISNHQYGISRLFVLKLEGSKLLRRISIFVIILPFIGHFMLDFMTLNNIPIEVGVMFFTIFIMILSFVFFISYASLQNKKIVKQIELEKRLAASERGFRSLVDSLAEGVASLNTDGRIKYCNPSFCSILGFEESELMGKDISEMVLQPNMRERYLDKLSLKDTEIDNLDILEIDKKSGEKVFVLFKCKSLFTDGVASNGYVISFTDITEERRKMEDLKAFSSSAAHDLNSPLAKIANLIELFETENLDEEQKGFLTLINATVSNMKLLLHDLLSFSRLGSAPLPKTELDLNILVKELCHSIVPATFTGELNIGSLPLITGNESAIKQLYTNLISNAIKYSSKIDHPKIEIGMIEIGEENLLYVKDNGVGLNDAQISQLFTPFKRFHAKFDGNGLGLAIVKRIIEKHGGSIKAESKENEGLRVYFTLAH